MTSKLNESADVLRAPLRLLPNIAVMGKMGAGKTTIANILQSQLSYEKLSFATALKNIAVDLWGQDALTDRGLMQDLGRKMREIDPMVWVNRALFHFPVARLDDGPPRIATGMTLHDNQLRPIVLDDLRFPNEYHQLRKDGFVIVRVEAHRNQRVNRLKAISKLQDESQLLDESETALDDAVADYTLTNTTTPLELSDAVLSMVERESRRNA